MVPLRTAIKQTGLCGNTLRKYADDGTIPSIRTPSGQRLFDVEAWIGTNRSASVICYCRVSSAKQRDDLERQVHRLRELFPKAEVIRDIGSGLNFKRKGLQTLLERLLRGDKLKVVVAHRDRLVRFGFDAIRFLVEKNGGELLVLDQSVGSAESELVSDLLSILHHFSCRMHGMRSHGGKENKTVPERMSKEDVSDMVRGIEIRLQQNGGDAERPEGIEEYALDGGGKANDGGHAGVGGRHSLSGKEDSR
jgi:putative resolvase